MLDEALRALAHPDRRMFLKACRAGSLSAGDLAAMSSLSAATVSEHLKVLRKTGLMLVERRGKSWLYTTDAEAVQAALADAASEVGAR